MRDLDRKVQKEFGFPEVVLVENAGRSLGEWMKNSGLIRPPLTRLLVLAGGGNNGADAMVAARHAASCPGLKIQVLTPGPVQKTLPLLEKSLLASWGIPCEEWKPGQELPEADIILDGLLGTGFSPPMRPEVEELIHRASVHRALRLAVDIPSGMSVQGGTFLKTQHTLSLGYPKTTLFIPAFRAGCGEIHHLSTGFPPDAGEDLAPGRLVCAEDLKNLVPILDPGVYKNRRGHVALWGGGMGTSGAPVLAAKGASSARAGLVTVLVPGEIYPVVASNLVAQMVLPWDNFTGRWEDYDSLVLGPGWKTNEKSLEILQVALASGLPTVLDAGALDVVGQEIRKGRSLNLRNTVLTPHPGEFARMTGLSVTALLQDPLGPLQDFCQAQGCWTVLKGVSTYIMSPEGRFWVCDGYNPAMATGGTGDVLAGMIGAFLAQKIPCEQAVNAGVLLHQLAGRLAWEERGWFDAAILPDFAARMLREMER